jgi:gluconate 2-dehydrogenase gamma chain
MTGAGRTRRDFLAAAGGALGAGWVAAHWPAIAAAHAHAVTTAGGGGPATLEALSVQQAGDIEALVAQIVPTDDTPGAREAGALYFIDRSLHTWLAAHAGDFHAGLRDFQQGFARAYPGRAFAAADADTQLTFLKSVERSQFFGWVRVLTLIGMFALPQYGGNRDRIGWRLIGFEDQHAFNPPFGHYDRDYPGFVLPEHKP